jgi:hypothetical protein
MPPQPRLDGRQFNKSARWLRMGYKFLIAHRRQPKRLPERLCAAAWFTNAELYLWFAIDEIEAHPTPA